MVKKRKENGPVVTILISERENQNKGVDVKLHLKAKNVTFLNRAF
jgi:hypothetical protein